jgi:transmembrane sensor
MTTPQDQTTRRIARLLVLYTLGLRDAELMEELNAWASESDINKQYFELVKSNAVLKRGYDLLELNKPTVPFKEQQILSKPGRAKLRVLTLKRLSIAASILIVVSAGIFFAYQNNHNTSKGISAARSVTDILPGSNKASLTLSSGKTIDLTEAGNVKFPAPDGITITSTDEEIVYNASGVKFTSTPDYHTITTPKGGQFRLKMADGTRVWLNAASSITFPVLTSNLERRVAISGEAYFEVAEQLSAGKNVPFFVDVMGKPISVEGVGTQFNINAYEDELIVTATLVNGIVNIKAKNNKQTLTSGQQAGIVDNNIKVVSLNKNALNAAKAWQQGYTNFESADLGTILRQVGRWYDVEIECSAAVAQRQFNGKIPRSDNLSSIINILTQSKITTTLKGRRLIVN